MSKHNSRLFLPPNATHIFILVVKLILVFGASFFIYHKLTTNNSLDFKLFNEHLKEYHLISVQTILILVSFSCVNWFLECVKWFVLVDNITAISIKKAIEQSLGAFTASIITPNRIGEYGAKAIYYPKPLRKKILGLTLIGNLAQLSTTLVFGTIGLLYAIYKFELSISYLNVFGICAISATVLVIYRMFFSKKEFEIKGYSLKKLKVFVGNLKPHTIYKTIGLSILRYLCFSHQFYILLWLFNVNVSYLEAFSLITSMYILTSIIPTVFVFDVLIKGSVAVWLFSFVNANEFIVVTCVTLMWLLNFALPSVIGSYFVLNFKLPVKE